MNEVWAVWCRFLAEHQSEGQPAEQHPEVQARLSRFLQGQSRSPEDVYTVLCALYRGGPLLLAALRWEEPVAGGNPKRRTPTDQHRGCQWRLVMAYGGFEPIVKSLLGEQGPGGLGPKHLNVILENCNLPSCPVLEPPRLSRRIEEEWLQTDPSTSDVPLLQYLGMNKKDAQAIYRHLADREPVHTWLESLWLAKALRNATAHGLLSASRVKEWKLRPAFDFLVERLADVSGAIFRNLCEPLPDRTEEDCDRS